MGSNMREDAKELIRSCDLTYMGATRRVVEATVAEVPPEDSIQLISAGELLHYHVLIPLPERATGAIVLCDSGVQVGWRVGFTGKEFHFMPWDTLVRANVELGPGGIKLEVADSEARFVLNEPLHGTASKAHSKAATQAFAAHLKEGTASVEQPEPVPEPEKEQSRRAHSKKNRKKKK